MLGHALTATPGVSRRSMARVLAPYEDIQANGASRDLKRGQCGGVTYTSESLAQAAQNPRFG
jgi:hypothetical protein